MRSRTVLLVCGFALAGGLALAQETKHARFFYSNEAGPMPHAMGQDVVVMAFGEKAVTGKPYSADGVTEFTQKLADGTTISRTNTSSVYRDGQGRTRREQTINVIGPYQSEGEPPRTIMIFDPVSGESITLNPRDKTARRVKLPPLPPAPPAGAVVSGDMKPMTFEKEVRVRIEGPESGAAPAHAAEFGGSQYNVMFHRGPADAKTVSLGTSTIEGLTAEGTKVTGTIPAGGIGNDRPITTVTTRWVSSDLGVVIQSETDDPLAGKTAYKLTNIRLGEPPANLFQIPADYTLKDATFKEVKDAGDMAFPGPGKAVIMHRQEKQN